MQAAEPKSRPFASEAKNVMLRGRPKEDPSLAEALDPEMAEHLGVPAVQLGLAKVAPADL
jgi:hypothetical protein